MIIAPKFPHLHNTQWRKSCRHCKLWWS